MTTKPLSPVPGHFDTDGHFCTREGQLTPGGRCPDGHDHADHYSNDGHPECEDNTTHHLVPGAGRMRCRYCGRTDVTTDEHCEKEIS